MDKYNLKRSELIQLVRDKPVLWDQTSDQYRVVKRPTKRDEWKEIAGKMNMKETEVKSIWKSLRDYYRLEVKKIMPKLPAGSAAPTIQEYLQVGGTWPFFSEMGFLFKTVVNRKTSSNMDITNNNDNSQEDVGIIQKPIVDGYGDNDNSNNNDCNEEKNDVSAMKDIDPEFEHNAMIINSPINDTTSQKSTRRKLSVSKLLLDVERRIELERKIAMKEKEETKKEEDDIDTFLKYAGSLLLQVKKQQKIQREIMNLIHNQLEEEEEEI